MTEQNAPSQAFRGWITERVTRSPGPILRLRSTRFGLSRNPEVELYYEAGDPHSHLAARILPKLQEYSRFPVRVRLVGEADPDLYPEAAKQRKFALLDYQRVAPAMGIRVPLEPQLPPEACRVIANCVLQHAIENDRFAETLPFRHIRQLLERQAGNVGHIRRHQRQYARRDKREQPCTKRCEQRHLIQRTHHPTLRVLQ